MQVSRSKKWASKPALDADGKPMLNAKGKQILKSSYSVLQDDFFHFMRSAGYDDIERGERGSTEEHLTVTQFKVKAEQQRLEAVSEQVAQAEQAVEKQEQKLDALKKETKTAKAAALTAREIKAMGKRNPLTGNVTLTAQECAELKKHAVNGLSARAEIAKLREQLAAAEQAAAVWKRRFDALHEKYETLKKKSQPYLAALKAAPEKVRLLSQTYSRGRAGEQERKQPRREHGRDAEL